MNKRKMVRVRECECARVAMGMLKFRQRNGTIAIDVCSIHVRSSVRLFV